MLVTDAVDEADDLDVTMWHIGADPNRRAPPTPSWRLDSTNANTC